MVVGLYENYNTISHRYICKLCQKENQKLKESVQAFADNNSVEVSVEKVKFKCTFMAWDNQTLPLYADGIWDLFQAFLTHKAGVDKKDY